MANDARIFELGDITADARTEADVCVVGTGAGGAAMARELAELGKSVVVLEEGPWVRPEQFIQDTWSAFKQLCRQKGMRAMMGKGIIPTQQGRAIGGSTILNSAICFRLSDNVINEWTRDCGLKNISPEILAPIYDKIENLIGVRETQPEVFGGNNLLFKKGCDELGIESRPIRRNEIDCGGCGMCMTGCPDGSRQSADISLVPQSVELGARVYSSCKATEVVRSGARITAVKGVFMEGEGRPTNYTMEVRCKALALCCGAIDAPVFLHRNDLKGPSGWAGKNLLGHMGVGVLGLYNEVVNGWDGASQGYESSHYANEGFILETVGLPPEVTALRMPGVGRRFKSYMSKSKNAANWGVMCRNEAQGKVIPPKKGWNPAIKYTPTDSDMEKIREGLKVSADIFFASGAYAVLPGIYGMPEMIKNPKDTIMFLSPKIDASRINGISNHPMGTCRMGEDPSESVVDSTGRMRHMDNIYIGDGGIFPTSPGINPQLTIMAFATHFARQLVDRL